MSTAVAERAPQAAPAGNAKPLSWLGERGMGASIVIAALSSAFGVFLINVTEYLAAWIAGSDLGAVAMVRFTLGIVTFVMVGLSMYVGAMATANTFSTIIAGRVQQIALLRLIGSSSQAQRKVVARQGLIVGIIGSLIGMLVGVGLSAIGAHFVTKFVEAQTDGAASTPENFSLWHWSFLVPVIAVILTTWAAAWVGSRRVLTVTPLEALTGSGDRTYAEVTGQKSRHVGAITLLVIGGALLAGGVVLGLSSPLGVLVAFFGGIFSFTGVVVGATLIMPPALRGFGKLFGKSATAQMAAGNALRAPERTSRMAIGVVMGVSLVVMFAVAMDVIKNVMLVQLTEMGDTGIPPEQLDEVVRMTTMMMDVFSAVMMGLVGVSAVIAGISLINLLTLGVVQRRRELGLLRAVGLTNKQIRRMVLLEAFHVVLTSIVVGLALGTFYGWAGAQSLIGSIVNPVTSETIGWIAPSIPWTVVLGVVGVTIALTLLAAVVPTRIATQVTPVEALRAE